MNLAGAAPDIVGLSSAARRDPRSRLGSLLDQIAVRGMCFAFETTLMPDPAELEGVRASAAPYVTPELLDEPARFFAFGAGSDPAPVRLIARRPLPDGEVRCQELASDYVPFHREAAPPPQPGNDRIPLEHWAHDRPAPATVIALHGFTMGDPRTDALALMAPEWFQLGLDVVLVTLPFHGTRTPPTARYSGELFASWHVGRLNEAIRQSVHDLRRVMAWLRSASGAPIGMIGLSLGGYLASLMAALSSELAFVIPIAAPVRLGSFPSTLFARSRYARRMAAPLSPAELDDAYRAHSPLTHSLALPRERALIVAGSGDCIVPPEQPIALWNHWQRPDIHWYSGSHVTPFRRSAVFAAGAEHVRRLGLLP